MAGSTTRPNFRRRLLGGVQSIGLLQKRDDVSGLAQDLIGDPRPDRRQSPVGEAVWIVARPDENLMDLLKTAALLQRL